MGRAERNAIPQYRPIPGSISSDPEAAAEIVIQRLIDAGFEIRGVRRGGP
jgi:hypothetical protein